MIAFWLFYIILGVVEPLSPRQATLSLGSS